MPITVVTLIIITAEATINMSYTSVTTVGRTTYKEYDSNVRTLTAAAAADDDTVFYRTEKVNNRTKMMVHGLIILLHRSFHQLLTRI